MTDFEKLSAAIDGEMSESELKGLIKGLQDEDFEKAESYYLVGDLLRSSDLGLHHRSSLTSRIQQVISQEPVVVAPTLLKQGSAAIAEESAEIRQLGRQRLRRSFAMAAGVALMALGLQQMVPPVDSNVRLVRSEPASKLSPAEVAAWQEYFLAHQQNVVRGGLSSVSPVVRADSETPNVRWVEQVNLNTSKGYDWMNVWDKPQGRIDSGKIQYVSSGR